MTTVDEASAAVGRRGIDWGRIVSRHGQYMPAGRIGVTLPSGVKR